MTSSDLLATTDFTGIAAAAYRLSSDGALTSAYPWQADLYARLSEPDGDMGGLLLAGTGAGKIESVLIPALGLHRGGAPRRLFLIGADGSPLDDYLYRAVPYLKSFVQADETPRTLFLDIADEDSTGNQCRRFFPDGTEDPQIITNPLEADVDLILTTFSRFRELFFGSGGVHALPAALLGGQAETPRRDLFFFDESHSYTDDAFSRFHRLTEFLFAEDMDVVVASSTMPATFTEELSFLEALPGPNTLPQPPRTLAYKPSADPLALIESEIRRAYFQNSRVFGVTETEAEAEALFSRLASAYPHNVYLYYTGQPAEARRRTYAQLRELEKEGEGYLLLTTGDALEASDLDATVLLSTLCPPENLIRRAGRCNRRGDLPSAQIVLVGDTLSPASRPLNPAQTADYLASLQAQTDLPFDPDFWKAFI
jgi:CRISPR-associated endonuclease/helicase Cas3